MNQSQKRRAILIGGNQKSGLDLRDRIRNLSPGAISSGSVVERTGVLKRSALPRRHKGDNFGYAVIGYADCMKRYLEMPSCVLRSADGERRGPMDPIDIDAGVFGVQIDIAYEVVRAYPEKDEAISVHSVAGAIAGAYPVITVFGQSSSAEKVKAKDRSREYNIRLIVERDPLPLINLGSDLDIRAQVVRDGRVIWDVTSMLKSPIVSIVWAAHDLRGRTSQFRPGQIVTSGTYPFLHQVKIGDRLIVDFGAQTRVTYRVV